MSNEGERGLIALVRSEQRGFRLIMFSGLALLFVLAIMSVALGFYYWRASQQLQTTIARQDFEARRKSEEQSTTIAAQGRRLDRIYNDIRQVSGGGRVGSEAAALQIAEAYLLRAHRLSFPEENALETAAAAAQTTNPALGHFLGAVVQLNAWQQRNNDAIPLGVSTLPAELDSVRQAFVAAREADPSFAQRASAGLAAVLNLEAAGPYSNYSREHCDALFAAVSAAPSDSPQPLYWQAQCERKLGRTSDALRDYARMLEQTWANAGNKGEGETFLAMNAFHGVGTTLIVLNNASDPAVAAALPLARQACAPDGEELMQLAISCLRRAIDLRQRALRQTPNEVNGTAENLGFAFLRTGDFEGAFANTQAVQRDSLFAWNELVRALSAAHLDTDEARAAAREARQNVGFFGISEFNPCEIKVLLNDDLFVEAVALISAGRSSRDRNGVQDAVVACAA